MTPTDFLRQYVCLMRHDQGIYGNVAVDRLLNDDGFSTGRDSGIMDFTSRRTDGTISPSQTLVAVALHLSVYYHQSRYLIGFLI